MNIAVAGTDINSVKEAILNIDKNYEEYKKILGLL